MNPQNSSPDSDSWSPDPNHSIPAQKRPSTFPKPADAWPSEEAAAGDVEPMTKPTPSEPDTSVEPVPMTDERIHQADAVEQDQSSSGGVVRARRRSPWFVVLIAAVAMMLVGGGVVAAYAWYDNADKVMADSMMQLMTAKSLGFNGTGNMKFNATNLSLTYNGASTQQELSFHGKLTAGSGSASLTAEGDVISDRGGNYYMKIENVKDMLASFLKSIPAAEKPQVDQMIAKVDDKWIKIPASSGGQAATGAPQLQQCFRAAFTKVQADTSYRDELTKLYDNHRFVIVKKNLGLSGMSVGYRLAIDPTKEREFVDGLPGTKLYGDLHKCDSALTPDSLKLDANAASLPEFELWANVLTHQPKRLTITNPATETATTYALTVNPVLNPNVTITAPKDATDIQQVQNDMLGLSMAAYGSVQQSLNSTAKSRTGAVTLQKKMEVYDAENGAYPTFTQVMSATGVAEIPADIKASVVPSAPPASGQLSLVPCKDATKGGTISYMDDTTGTVKTLQYGAC